MAATALRLRNLVNSGFAVSKNTSVQEDVELAVGPQQAAVSHESHPYMRGFPSLAAFMSDNACSESFVFLRFDRLSARNLLYLQSELAELQKQMDEFDMQDARPPYDLEARRCARSWEDFERVKGQDAKQQERWALMIKIRETLREYRTWAKYTVYIRRLTAERKIQKTPYFDKVGLHPFQHPQCEFSMLSTQSLTTGTLSFSAPAKISTDATRATSGTWRNCTPPSARTA
jgi:hypothetical protein